MTLPALEKILVTPEDPAPEPKPINVMASTVIQFDLPGIEKVEETMNESEKQVIIDSEPN